MKLNFFIFFLLIFSCNSNNSIHIDELSNPCDCLNEKIKVYKKIDKIYINNFDSINNNKISLMDLELFDDFSEIFLLIQKIEEIDFKIKLNSWKSDLKKCENYSKYIEFKDVYY